MSNDLEENKKITFAESEKEASAKFTKYANQDPLPNVPSALLNSADIQDYVAITGMIFPFYPNPEKGKLKTASYEVDLLGKIIYWDEHGNKITEELTRGKQFKLISNSIAFVTPEPTFRLPDYIAVRFNLKITHVHRGILLGTGPLVDPGYEGKLLIPLHNLTANDYVFTGGEGFIWIEFTKLSPSKKWICEDERFERTEDYMQFPKNKKYLDQETLIAKALKNQAFSTIRSSITPVFLKIREDASAAKEEAKKAKEEAEKAKEVSKKIQDEITSKLRKYSFWGVAGLLVALLGILVSVFLGNRQFISLGIENQKQIEQLRQEVKNIRTSSDTKDQNDVKPVSESKLTPSKSDDKKK